ncbi:hypothetical protein IQ07DRAFT_595771 [Pyrenochaeta sp. DS3sAY3a]|nr:hypothetical protein IQ07DRAFT_595771 [Pyrenochaeta sp. DS3sAY3a]
MDSRRITVFPKTGNTLINADIIPRASKRKILTSDRPISLELPRVFGSIKIGHKVLNPKEQNPDEIYKCIYLVDPQGKRPYALAQERNTDKNLQAYRIVMIRRTAPNRAVVGIDRPHVNVLNILDVFQFDGSTFTIYDRPGLPLSELIVCVTPQIGVSEIQTISKEALQGINALCDAGFSIQKLHLEDITVSGHDGRVQVEFRHAIFEGPEATSNASSFKVLLDNVILKLPRGSTLLQNRALREFIESSSDMTYGQLQMVS